MTRHEVTIGRLGTPILGGRSILRGGDVEGQVGPNDAGRLWEKAVRSWIPGLTTRDPQLAALRSAGRAAIVMPAVFAVAERVIRSPEVATFAAFGSLAILTLVEFGGPVRSRLAAYLTLVGAGAVNIVIGTLCSGNPWLGAAIMGIVALAISLSGIINGYFAAAGTPAMLTFILPVMLQAPPAAVAPRLEGWALASAAGVAAQMLLWPNRPQDSLRAEAARACRALAALVEVSLGSGAGPLAERTAESLAAVTALRRRLLALPHRPAGATRRQAALSSLVDELEWLESLLSSPAPGVPPPLCAAEGDDAAEAAIASLLSTAARLEGGRDKADTSRLNDTRRALAHALAAKIPTLPSTPEDDGTTAVLERAFRIRILSLGAESIAGFALIATGAGLTHVNSDGREPLVASRRVRSRLRATREAARQHTSVRSVWFRNGVRAAVGLSVAVLVANFTGLQHSFWVVLGTLSVLRSNALATGWSIVSALLGTAVGIVIGAALVIVIGTRQDVLWAVLPVALLLASYAPRAVSFAAGQAGFTIWLVVLFNIIQPVGWQVGLVRIEDVAIGFVISLGVGILFWPRGVTALLRDGLATAFARQADFVLAAYQQLLGRIGSEPAAVAAASAASAEDDLDDAYRQYLAEGRHDERERTAILVSGAGRLGRTAQSLVTLASMGGVADLSGCAKHLDSEVLELHFWYRGLGEALASTPGDIPPPHKRDPSDRQRFFECVREALRGTDRHAVRATLNLLWASQHLDVIWRQEEHLGSPRRAGSTPS